MNDIYGRLTGRKRWTIVLIGALSGLTVGLSFAWFAGRGATSADLIIGAILGGLLGLSASLGEKRRRHTPDGD